MFEAGTPKPPGPMRLFTASLIAAGIYYVAVLLLLTVVALVSVGGPLRAFGVFSVYGMYGLFIAVLLAFVLVAPLSTALGLIMLRLAPQGRWTGGLIGGLIVAIVFLGFWIFAASEGESHSLGTFAPWVALTAIGAATGWFVQHRILRWPINA